MLSLVLAGLTIGIAAGLKPGALGVYVIHQTMAKGKWHGFLASMAPLITDGPVILLSLFLTQEFKDINWLIGLISFVGSAYLILIAFRILRTPLSEALRPATDAGQSSLIGAIKLNLVNPAPYVFWFSIGSAFIASTTAFGAWAFALCTTTMLCLTKFLVAIAIKTLGDQFNSRIYGATLKFLAIPLIIFSVHLFVKGVTAWMSLMSSNQAALTAFH